MSYYPARTAARPRGGIGLLGIVYLVAGAIVAATHHYYAHLHSAKGIGSAVVEPFASSLAERILGGRAAYLNVYAQTPRA